MAADRNDLRPFVLSANLSFSHSTPKLRFADSPIVWALARSWFIIPRHRAILPTGITETFIGRRFSQIHADKLKNQRLLAFISVLFKKPKVIFVTVLSISSKRTDCWRKDVMHDSTGAEIAKSLIEIGIPSASIVLGFYPERHRQYPAFAIN